MLSRFALFQQLDLKFALQINDLDFLWQEEDKSHTAARNGIINNMSATKSFWKWNSCWADSDRDASILLFSSKI